MQVDWDKGYALAHLLTMLGVVSLGEGLAIYIGDDRTDEDAFAVLKNRGLGTGILVSTRVKPTDARYTLTNPDDVQRFLGQLVEWGRTPHNAWHRVGSCNGWRVAPGRRTGENGGDAVSSPTSLPLDGLRVSGDGGEAAAVHDNLTNGHAT